MKNVFKISILFIFVFLKTGLLVAQSTDLLPESSRELITKIEHENFTLILEKFVDDGIPDLSMSKGFEFIRIGNDLTTILNTLWPGHYFSISNEIQIQKYHLRLHHLDQKRTNEFMETVLDEFLNNSGFQVALHKEILRHYCVEVSTYDMLVKHHFESDRGIIRSTTYLQDCLVFAGYTLHEVLKEVSNHSGHSFSLDLDQFSDQIYELSIDVKHLESIKASLKGYGLSYTECEREVEVIYME
ncbi:hypothetical protein [Anditalea andensis]|uniref:Uncharacterized protein n=1 Tax=Anditalea andensis TaxID=1048983 RepID=A0A074L2Y8_9BACT|nr:hypothetical protein [Anditalea andensis]KEO74865.1 hypothetical protein EL17_04080 [Anditalea andensis]